MDIVLLFFMFILIACAAGGIMRFLQWRKDTAGVRAELELRQKEGILEDTEAATGKPDVGDDGSKRGSQERLTSRDLEVESVTQPAAVARPDRVAPPSLESLAGPNGFFAASPARSDVGGWGTMRTASRQIQSARALGVIRALSPPSVSVPGP